jgi:hypothetical protein
MPLFGGQRDAGFLKRVNKELLQKVIGIEVAVYKIAIEHTPVNIYGESSSKKYYNPIRVHALVRKDDTLSVNSETGEIDTNKNLTIGFLRDELVEKKLVIEISDIIYWDGGYYQVDNVKKTNYWWGRNPEESIPVVEGDTAEHGYAVSIIAECHLTSITNLDLVDNRVGINKITKLPKNL